MNSISNQYAKKLFFPTMNKQFQIHFYTNIIPPYRYSLFNSMNRNISLHVHTASRKEADRGWTDFSNEREFQLTEHHLRKLKLGEKYFYFPNLSWLKIYKNDVIIIGGWEQPANIILIFFCLAKRKRFYLFSESTDNDAGISSSGIIRKVKKGFSSRLREFLPLDMPLRRILRILEFQKIKFIKVLMLLTMNGGQRRIQNVKLGLLIQE